MKRSLVLLILITTWAYIFAQDLVILRSGDIYEGKVIQASQSAVIVESKTGNLFSKEKAQTNLDPSQVYMIKYKERGNIYFKEDGKRVSGENQKLDKSADIIYLRDGKEIPAWGLSFSQESITFRTTKQNKKAISNTLTVATPEVFMIRYSDGSRDVINDLTIESNPVASKSTEPKEEEPQFKIIFHTIRPGDTLAKLASQYEVTVDDIRKWNEVDSHVRSDAKLKAGTQYMIQQPISK